MELKSVLIGSEHPEGLIDFYKKLFGQPSMEQGGFAGWQLGGGWLTVGPHDQVKGKNVHPGRVIWNIETSDVRADFEKLKAAGATVVKEPYDAEDADMKMSIATFSDPDNNMFQLMTAM